MGLPIYQEAEKPAQSAHQMPATGVPHEQEKEEVGKNLAQVKRKIGVHSGKGGVGKTFIAVNLALALAATGKKVGLLDADVDCPNVAKVLNLRATALEGTADGRIMPLEHRDLKIVSTHFLTDSPDAPMIVRGPIKHKVVAELLSRVAWDALDVLVVDLPPGTSDVPLSSMMIGHLDGIIVVTTPQKEALMDARKSALMARDLQVPILGVIENMSGEVFGTGAGMQLAQELNVAYLGSIPLSKEIRELTERGRAALVEHREYKALAPALIRGAMGEELAMKQSFWKNLLNR